MDCNGTSFRRMGRKIMQEKKGGGKKNGTAANKMFEKSMGGMDCQMDTGV